MPDDNRGFGFSTVAHLNCDHEIAEEIAGSAYFENPSKIETSMENSEHQLASFADYRKAMVGYLVEANRSILELLNDADFGAAFPHLFGEPTKKDPKVSVRNTCGLLLQKAQLHIVAVLRANETSNLHSVAVHMRVVMECAAQIVSQANAAHEGTEKSVARIINVFEYEVWDSMNRLRSHDLNQNGIEKMIVSARMKAGDGRNKKPKRVTISQKVGDLPRGRDWWNHLSEFFCDSKVGVLSGISYRGGVMSNTTDSDQLTFATFLDQLTRYIALLLVGYGFLLIAVNGDRAPFEAAVDLSDRYRSEAKMYRTQRATHSLPNEYGSLGGVHL